MTYKESYLALNSVEEILEEATKDVKLAMAINTDRVSVIKRHSEEAIAEKFESVGDLQCLKL